MTRVEILPSNAELLAVVNNDLPIPPNDALEGVVLTTNTTLSALVPEHPVQGGVDASDHIQRRPPRVVLQQYITDTPGAGQQTPGGVAQAVRFWGRVQSEERLVRIVDEEEGVLTPYAVESVNHVREALGGRLFTVNLKFFRFVTAEFVEIPPQITRSPGNASAQSSGNQSGEERDQTALLQVGIATGLFSANPP